jgi:hypothetical protein
MTPEDERALEESIQKWHAIVCDDGIDDGCDNCALCQLDKSRTPADEELDDCTSCIVYEATGCADCGQTPYIQWACHHRDKHQDAWPRCVECDTCQELAVAELEFLISLRE